MSKLFPAVVLLPLTLGACLPQSEPAASTDDDVAAVLAVRDAEVASIIGGDTVLAHMADDVLLMPPNEPAREGKAAARAWMQAMNQQATVQSLNYTTSTVTIAGDWAIEPYAGSATIAPIGGAPVTETVKGIHIYRRQADGSWKLVQDAWNGDQPPPGMEM